MALLPKEYRETKKADNLVDLHVYVVPLELWLDKYRKARNTAVLESVSAGFIRVPSSMCLHFIRDTIIDQIGSELVPEKYIFLRSVGRCLAVVNRTQELVMTAADFADPVAHSELLLLPNATDVDHTSSRNNGSTQNKIMETLSKSINGSITSQQNQMDAVDEGNYVHFSLSPRHRTTDHADTPAGITPSQLYENIEYTIDSSSDDSSTPDDNLSDSIGDRHSSQEVILDDVAEKNSGIVQLAEDPDVDLLRARIFQRIEKEHERLEKQQEVPPDEIQLASRASMQFNVNTYQKQIKTPDMRQIDKENLDDSDFPTESIGINDYDDVAAATVDHHSSEETSTYKHDDTGTDNKQNDYNFQLLNNIDAEKKDITIPNRLEDNASELSIFPANNAIESQTPVGSYAEMIELPIEPNTDALESSIRQMNDEVELLTKSDKDTLETSNDPNIDKEDISSIEPTIDMISSIEPGTDMISSIEPATDMISSIQRATDMASSIEPPTDMISSIEPPTDMISSIEPATDMISPIEPATDMIELPPEPDKVLTALFANPNSDGVESLEPKKDTTESLKDPVGNDKISALSDNNTRGDELTNISVVVTTTRPNSPPQDSNRSRSKKNTTQQESESKKDISEKVKTTKKETENDEIRRSKSAQVADLKRQIGLVKADRETCENSLRIFSKKREDIITEMNVRVISENKSWKQKFLVEKEKTSKLQREIEKVKKTIEGQYQKSIPLPIGINKKNKDGSSKIEAPSEKSNQRNLVLRLQNEINDLSVRHEIIQKQLVEESTLRSFAEQELRDLRLNAPKSKTNVNSKKKTANGTFSA